MSFSYWEKNTFIKSPDVAIIGSGIVGLSAALAIKKISPKKHVIVFERGMLPYGASTRNAGFACYGSVSELLEDLQHNSADEVFSLVERRWKGLQRLRENLSDAAIEYEELGGFEVFTSRENNLFEKCISSLPFLNSHLKIITGEIEMYRCVDERISTFGFRNIDHMILNSGEGQIDTGKMMKSLLHAAISAGVEVLNGADVDHFEENSVGVNIHLNNYEKDVIHASRVLICTNGFAKRFLPDYDIQPARSQVLITDPIENLKVKGSFHYDHGFYYFRNVGNRLLFGGGRNTDFKTENTSEFGTTQIIQSNLDEMLRNVILPSQNYTIEMRWSGIMGLGTTKKPIIKKTGENIYCAVRMGGMGIAIGSLVGEDAAKMILESF